ncbi:hypothetical protein Ancab_035579, partial [Ancistrocladus abbreviatus]
MANMKSQVFGRQISAIGGALVVRASSRCKTRYLWALSGYSDSEIGHLAAFLASTKADLNRG